MAGAADRGTQGLHQLAHISTIYLVNMLIRIFMLAKLCSQTNRFLGSISYVTMYAA